MRISLISAAVTLALATSFSGAAWAQSGQNSNQQPQGNTSGQGQSGAQNPTVKLTPSDQAFLSNEARSVNAEIQYGNLAQENGSNPQVKKLGETMVTDGQADRGQLQGIAEASGVTLPSEIQPSDQQALDKLKNLQGQAFDQEFTSRVQQHERNELSRLQLESKSASHPELRSYANKQMSSAQLMMEASKNTSVTEKQAPNEGTQQQQNQQPRTQPPQTQPPQNQQQRPQNEQNQNEQQPQNQPQNGNQNNP